MASGYDMRVGDAERDAAANELREQFQGVATVLAPEDMFCNQSQTCDLLPDGKPLLFDSHHPSMHTALLTASKLLPLING